MKEEEEGGGIYGKTTDRDTNMTSWKYNIGIVEDNMEGGLGNGEELGGRGWRESGMRPKTQTTNQFQLPVKTKTKKPENKKKPFIILCKVNKTKKKKYIKKQNAS